MDADSGFSNIAVIGLGLMGGSLALAVKQFTSDLEIIGVDYSEQLEKALSRRAIDRGFKPEDVDKAVKGSDLVVLATPISEILKLVKKLPGLLREGTAVLDLGSTKKEICSLAERRFSKKDCFFFGGHPMTGAETSGMTGAHPLLYENSVFVLVEVGDSPGEVERSIEDFIKEIGSQPIRMSAEEHDRVVARISHLPQLVSIALANSVGRGENPDLFLDLSGGGLKDMTRIAASPYGMWEDILETNKRLIGREVDVFIEKLEELRKAIAIDEVREHFQRANSVRGKMPSGGKGLTSRTYRIAVMVPDRPGALAELTSSLGEEGLNIKNIELQKVREDYRGTFHVYFSTLDDAKLATSVLNEEDFEARVMD